MIKVINHEPTQEVKKYPRLIKSTTTDKIILMVSEGEGYVLNAGNNNDCRIGEKMDPYMPAFSDYNEPITIQNV
jgi:hypothetical protein